MEKYNKEKADFIEKQKKELISLRSFKIEADSKIFIQTDTIKNMQVDYESKNSLLLQSENRIVQLNDIIEK